MWVLHMTFLSVSTYKKKVNLFSKCLVDYLNLEDYCKKHYVNAGK